YKNWLNIHSRSCWSATGSSLASPNGNVISSRVSSTSTTYRRSLDRRIVVRGPPAANATDRARGVEVRTVDRAAGILHADRLGVRERARAGAIIQTLERRTYRRWLERHRRLTGALVDRDEDPVRPPAQARGGAH